MQSANGTTQQAPSAPHSLAPNINWVGPPVKVEPHAIHYRSAKVAGQQISLGDFVYLQPAEPGLPLYIARVDDLLHLSPTPAPGQQHPPAGEERPGGTLAAAVSWFYRPQELDLDAPLPVFENEVFMADEGATHPLESVAGRCIVVRPGLPNVRLQPGAAQDVFVCSRKYIPSEGRVVPVEGLEDELGTDIRPFVLVNGRLLTRPKHGHISAKPPSTKPTPSHRRKREASPHGARASTATPTASQGQAQAQGLNTAAPGPAPTMSTRKRPSPGWGPTTTGTGGGAPPPPSGGAAPTPSASVSQEVAAGTGGGTAAGSDKSGGGGGTPKGASTPGSARAGKEHHGRWSKERYDAAQRSLIHILRWMGATSPDLAVLRPALREEARKVIGDTGLLDHLLKHLADRVVSDTGERLRRRHNREGHMEYWLQSPAAAEQEEAMMNEELTALTSELREVREVRHVLQVVRSEAAQAIQAVSQLKEKPEEAAASLMAVGTQVPSEMGARLEEVERTNVDLMRRLHDAEALAASRLEDMRQEMAAAGRLMSEHIEAFRTVTGDLKRRCEDLECKAAVATEDAAGRFEAVGSALSQAVAFSALFRQELQQRDSIIAYLQRESATLRQLLTTQAQTRLTPTSVPGAGMERVTSGEAPDPLAHASAAKEEPERASYQPDTPPSPGVAITPAMTVPLPVFTAAMAEVMPGGGAGGVGSGKQIAPSAAGAPLTAAGTTAGSVPMEMPLQMPGQALEPATLQDMSVVGAEVAHGINPLNHPRKESYRHD